MVTSATHIYNYGVGPSWFVLEASGTDGMGFHLVVDSTGIFGTILKESGATQWTWTPYTSYNEARHAFYTEVGLG